MLCYVCYVFYCVSDLEKPAEKDASDKQIQELVYMASLYMASKSRR